MERGEANPLWILLAIVAAIVGAAVVYGILLPTVCWAFEPIAAEPIC